MKEFIDFENVFHRALEHYGNKLRDISCESEINKLISNDLIKNADEVDEFKKDLNKFDDKKLTEWAKKNLCLALQCYIDDLQNAINETKERINNLNIDFNDTQEEIDLADEARKKYCPNDWSPRKKKKES